MVLSVYKNKKIDIIHAHRLFPEGYAALLLSRMLRVPFVVSARGSDVNIMAKQKGVRSKVMAVIKEARYVFAVSKDLAQKISSIEPASHKIKTIEKGVDNFLFQPRDKIAARKFLGLSENKYILLFVGNLVPVKNPKALIDVLSGMSEYERKEYFSVFIGEGPLRSMLKRKIRERKLDAICSLPGSVSPDKVACWMNAADVFFLPSRNEGMPNVLYEAMACGLPIIASRVGGIPEIVADQENGFLLVSDDIDGMKKAVQMLFADEEKRRSIGEKNIIHMRNLGFTWEKNSRYINDLYKKAMA